MQCPKMNLHYPWTETDKLGIASANPIYMGEYMTNQTQAGPNI